jgi:hypothetical protein
MANTVSEYVPSASAKSLSDARPVACVEIAVRAPTAG